MIGIRALRGFLLAALLHGAVSFAQTVSFSPATNYAVGADPFSVAIGDLNADGKPDLAVTNQSSDNVSILLNTAVSPNQAPAITRYVFSAKFCSLHFLRPTGAGIGGTTRPGVPLRSTPGYLPSPRWGENRYTLTHSHWQSTHKARRGRRLAAIRRMRGDPRT